MFLPWRWLEQWVEELDPGRLLSDNRQDDKQRQYQDHGQHPPQLLSPQETQQFLQYPQANTNISPSVLGRHIETSILVHYRANYI